MKLIKWIAYDNGDYAYRIKTNKKHVLEFEVEGFLWEQRKSIFEDFDVLISCFENNKRQNVQDRIRHKSDEILAEFNTIAELKLKIPEYFI